MPFAMANKETAFIAAIRIAAEERPDCFSMKDGDLRFLDWSIPAWLLLAASGPSINYLLATLKEGVAA